MGRFPTTGELVLALVSIHSPSPSSSPVPPASARSEPAPLPLMDRAGDFGVVGIEEPDADATAAAATRKDEPCPNVKLFGSLKSLSLAASSRSFSLRVEEGVVDEVAEDEEVVAPALLDVVEVEVEVVRERDCSTGTRTAE